MTCLSRVAVEDGGVKAGGAGRTDGREGIQEVPSRQRLAPSAVCNILPPGGSTS